MVNRPNLIYNEFCNCIINESQQKTNKNKKMLKK